MQCEIFEIVEGAIGRRWPEPALRRRFWKTLWRMNARLRLLLTLRARLQSGHADAACAVWNLLMRGTGRKAPKRLGDAGWTFIRWWCERRRPEFDDVRQSVSPL